MYGFGKSEELVCDFIRRTSGSPAPFIATKFAPLPWRFSADTVEKALQVRSHAAACPSGPAWSVQAGACLEVHAEVVLHNRHSLLMLYKHGGMRKFLPAPYYLRKVCWPLRDG